MREALDYCVFILEGKERNFLDTWMGLALGLTEAWFAYIDAMRWHTSLGETCIVSHIRTGITHLPLTWVGAYTYFVRSHMLDDMFC
jgi:hypothetical protein